MHRRSVPRSIRMSLAVAAVATVGVGLAACGSDDDDAGAKPAASTGASSTTAVKKRVKIGLELIVTGVPFSQTMKDGAEAAAAEDGAIDLEVQGPPKVDPALAQKQTTDLLSQRPDGMAVAPFPPEVWLRGMKTVHDKVSNSVAFGVKPAGVAGDAASAPLQTYVGPNDAEGARKVATKAIEVAGLDASTTGHAILGQCVPGKTGALAERTAAFTEVVKAKLPKVKIITFGSKPDPQGNTASWQSALRADPDPVLTLGTCDQDATSMYKLKKSTSGKFAIGALEPAADVIQGIADGVVEAGAKTNFYLEGYAAVRLLAAGARGEELPEGWVDVGFTLVTKANATEALQAEGSGAAAKTAWTPAIDKLFGDLSAATHPLVDAWK